MTAEPNTCLTVSVDEAARLLGFCRNTTYKGVREGTIRSIRIGDRYRIPRIEIDRLLTGSQQSPT